MGYYTRYTLSTIGKNSLPITSYLNEEELVEFYMDESGETIEPTKWYDHSNDIKRLSKKFPDTIFKLEGVGEESGDIWIKYFKNGKRQICEAKITFDEYDENKLTDEKDEKWDL